MLRTHEEFRCAIPYRHHDFIASEEGLERLMTEPRETQVADFDDALGGDEDVGWFKVTVENVGGVEIDEAVEELVDEGFEHCAWDGGADGLVVVMNYLLILSMSERDLKRRRLTRKSCSAYSKTM
jgi:hypothetical protein